MNNEDVISKIQKLLALGTSNNQNESASAISLASKLMEKHNISEAMLQKTEEEQEIQCFDEALWGEGGKNRSHWRVVLSTVLSEVNACITFTEGSAIKIIGRKDDVNTVRYFFQYSEKEIERLALFQRGFGRGKGWINEYKMGAVIAIGLKLKEAKQEARNEFIQEQKEESASHSSSESYSAETAIAKLDQKFADTKAWYKNVFSKQVILVPGNSYGKQQNHETAFEKGQKDGSKINLSTNSSGLEAGSKQLSDKN